MSATIILPKNFDISSVSFGAVRTLESGGKSIYVAYNGKPMVFQTPKCHAPFGISKWSDEKGSSVKNGSDKYSLELSFQGYEQSGSTVKSFFDTVKSIDSLIKEQAVTNSLTWFNKKKFTETQADDSFSSQVKYHMENGEASTKKYAPRIRLTVPTDRDGNFACNAFINRVKVPLSPEMTKNCNVTAIIRASGLWIISSRYGITYKVEQLLIEPRDNYLEKFAFVTDGDEADVRNPVQNSEADVAPASSDDD